ncbi:beta-galactosidase [Sphingomonas morindae]|uniref:beta-galactosidase n=1 Tax=Sphingomonas morindae TaxID=1541170 RepID=A0ABY4X5R3_9SPHN|nr:beta-galactosidase [Sphingomonas morindae]USI72219.1 beta-galactosidase [Sphingomonas morindae]
MRSPGALMGAAALAALVAGLGAGAPARAAPPASRVGFDAHSFTIDGKRLYIWSGEFHPYRLPSPDLWPDIFQKMKAAGFNAASIYFSWGYHSAAPGHYDFTGIRDMDRLLDAARDAGIYIIARPGPYINAEVDSGGFPLWFTTRPLANRSPDPAYLAAADEWLTQIDRIIARHQIDGGRGTVIAYQVENEYYKGSDQGRAYMQHLKAKARADGISVPLVGNHNGTFVDGVGAMQVSGWDHYPQGFDCSTPEKWNAAPDMADEHGAGQPIFAAEYQGGAFDPWGGPGYGACAKLINDRFANVFYKQNIAAGATAQNFYMVYGGTSWGWQAIPQNYTSYDYGAAITEGRQFDPKYYEMKRIGYMLAASAPLLSASAATPARVDDPAVIDVVRRDAASGSEYHLLRHGDTTAATPASVHIALALKDGRYPRVPQAPGTAITLDGREAKLLAADTDLAGQHLVYSTSELMTADRIGERDVVLLHGRPGSPGETVLRFARRPEVTVIAGAATLQWEKKRDLRINYSHDGLIRLSISGGGRPPLLLLIADTPSTEQVWRAETGTGPVLLLGAPLLRQAVLSGDTLALTGDGAAQEARAELFAPPAARLRWNGAAVTTAPAPDGGLAFTVPARPRLVLPALGPWERRAEAPEIDPDFPDQTWQEARLRSSASITKPGSLPVLFADDYGFHTGNTWYRGHFRNDAGHVPPTGIRLKVISGGKGGAYSAWLNGRFLGSVTGGEDGAFGFPQAALRRGDNVLSVLTVDMGHEEDYDSKGENRTARGIVSAVPLGAEADAIGWRIQGRRGGDGATDALRGPYNEGGLFGEREGWHLGKGGDAGWHETRLASNDDKPGVSWYRTTVRLDLPRGADASLGLRIADPPGRHYRAILFVNGWQFGHYVSDLGPQHDFPVPAGILDPHGPNRISVAVWKTDASPGGLGAVSLIDYAAMPAR